MVYTESSNKHEKVWYRFEKSKGGAVYKLRIQDLPRDRLDEAVDLMMRYYAEEEPVHKAAGMTKNPETIKLYSEYLKDTLHEPNFAAVICCSDDDDDDVKDIMGISFMALTTDYNSWDTLSEDKKPNTTEWKKFMEVCTDIMLRYNPMEEHKLSVFYDDRALLVLPVYRGLGIAEALFKSRRLMSAAHGVPMAGAWMTSHGSQIAAQRDGWEVASEITYEDLAARHGLTFSGVPDTMKFMIGRAHT